MRPESTHDDATPNPNGVAAQNLVRLAVLAGDDAWRARADSLFDGLMPIAAANLFGHLSLLNALDLRLRAAEIVIVREGPHIDALVAAVQHIPFTTASLLRAQHRLTGCPPRILRRRKLQRPRTGRGVRLRRARRCSLPVTDPEQLAETLRSMRA